MARRSTGFFHHIGTFLLLAATILLIVTCISAPVVNHIALLKLDHGSSSGARRETISFGSFGWCRNIANAADVCSRRHVGYDMTAVMTQTEKTRFSEAAHDSARALTRAMVLHPIACALSFVAFLLALGAGVVGSFLASLVALLAFVVTAVAVVIDFVLFSIVRSNVNDSQSGSRAHYSAAAWTLLVAAICSLLGTIVVFFTCCSARLHRRRTGVMPVKERYGGATMRRRWF